MNETIKSPRTEAVKSLQYETKAIDVTDKGIVTVAVNGIGIEDCQHDISMPGSFDQTLREDIGKARWYLNHDQRILLGVPLSGKEEDGNLVMEGKMNLDKQICRDVFTDYKLFAECGRTLEHSIGCRAMARDEEDRRKVVRWKLYEYSTLTNWGANPQTFLVGLKSGSTEEQIREAVSFIRKAFEMRGYSDERLKNYDMELNLLLKSLSGGTVVACPCCGHQFDYDSVAEHNFTTEVQEAARDWLVYTARGEARQYMENFRPEIREQVISVIDSLKGTAETLTEKSITDALAYVRCPNCWSRVYRSNALLAENAETKQEEAEVTEKGNPEPVPAASFWTRLNDNIKNINQ